MCVAGTATCAVLLVGAFSYFSHSHKLCSPEDLPLDVLPARLEGFLGIICLSESSGEIEETKGTLILAWYRVLPNQPFILPDGSGFHCDG